MSTPFVRALARESRVTIIDSKRVNSSSILNASTMLAACCNGAAAKLFLILFRFIRFSPSPQRDIVCANDVRDYAGELLDAKTNKTSITTKSTRGALGALGALGLRIVAASPGSVVSPGLLGAPLKRGGIGLGTPLSCALLPSLVRPTDA